MTAFEMETVESCRSLGIVPVSPTLYEPLKSRVRNLEGVLSDPKPDHFVFFVSAFRRRGPRDAPMARSTASRAWCVKSGVTGRWSVPRMT